MPFIRGIVFSSEILDGCQLLRDQLQMLHWGGLHLAVLTPNAPAAAAAAGADTEPPQSASVGSQPPTATSSSSSGGSGRYGCEALAVLHLQPTALGGQEEVADAKHDDVRPSAVAAAAEAAAASWAAALGLLWPEEVLVLALPGDGVGGALRQRLQQQQQRRRRKEHEGRPGDASDTLVEEELLVMLPGIALGRIEEAVKAAPWQRLRLALAHANLQRALTETAAKEVMAHDPQDTGDRSPGGASLFPAAPPAAAVPPLLVVGTAMKPSRERDLAKDGLLNLVPMDGLVFAPLDLSLPLEEQLPFHAILHKASDELEYGEDGAPRFGPRVRALADFVSRQAPLVVSLVDPLEAAAKVINRTELARVCDSLSFLDLSTIPNTDKDLDLGPAAAAEAGASTGHPAAPIPPDPPAPSGDGDGGVGAGSAGDSGSGRQETASPAAVTASSCVKRQRVEGGVPGCVAATEDEVEVGARGQAGVRVRVRAPRSTTVSGFTREEVEAAMERLGCPPPYIVKPVVACGTPDSHRMALVLHREALEGLGLPLPAVVQEFVNHDATIFKVYVAGDKVFHTVRPSIPNIPQDRSKVLQLAPRGELLFDSLKSLPTSLRPLQAGQSASAAAVTANANAAAPVAAAAAAAAVVRRPSQVVLERLAAHLRAELGLSLFGFDVVVAAGPYSGSGRTDGDGGDGMELDVNGDGGFSNGVSNGDEKQQPQHQHQHEHQHEHQELVVVDVNYFPSYRGAEGAPKLFRAAVRQAYERQQRGSL